MPLLKESLALYMKLLPKDHPTVVFVMCNLALTYFRLKMYDKATSVWEHSLALANKILHDIRPEKRVFIGEAMHKLAGTYLRLGKHKEALNLFEQLRALYKRILPPGDPKIDNIARCIGKIQSNEVESYDDDAQNLAMHMSE